MNTVDILARTLHAEAGDCALRGVEALAALVLRRARMALACEEARLRFAQGAWAGSEAAMVIAVCRAPFQFSCWRAGGPAWDAPAEDAHLAMCQRVAARALAGGLPDMAPGATHWHDARSLPAWAVGRVPVAEAGGLALYRLAA
jgi:spore germination cell wall hydrolase CwlJ-like protein